MKIEALTKKNEALMSEKASIETDLIARMHDLQANRREIQKQISNRPLEVIKVKQRKRLVARQEVAYIAKKLKYRFIRHKIQYKNIASVIKNSTQTIDTTKLKDLFRPTYHEIQELLS